MTLATPPGIWRGDDEYGTAAQHRPAHGHLGPTLGGWSARREASDQAASAASQVRNGSGAPRWRAGSEGGTIRDANQASVDGSPDLALVEVAAGGDDLLASVAPTGSPASHMRFCGVVSFSQRIPRDACPPEPDALRPPGTQEAGQHRRGQTSIHQSSPNKLCYNITYCERVCVATLLRSAPSRVAWENPRDPACTDDATRDRPESLSPTQARGASSKLLGPAPRRTRAARRTAARTRRCPSRRGLS